MKITRSERVVIRLSPAEKKDLIKLAVERDATPSQLFRQGLKLLRKQVQS